MRDVVVTARQNPRYSAQVLALQSAKIWLSSWIYLRRLAHEVLCVAEPDAFHRHLGILRLVVPRYPCFSQYKQRNTLFGGLLYLALRPHLVLASYALLSWHTVEELFTGLVVFTNALFCLITFLVPGFWRHPLVQRLLMEMPMLAYSILPLLALLVPGRQGVPSVLAEQIPHRPVHIMSFTMWAADFSTVAVGAGVCVACTIATMALLQQQQVPTNYQPSAVAVHLLLASLFALVWAAVRDGLLPLAALMRHCSGRRRWLMRRLGMSWSSHAAPGGSGRGVQPADKRDAALVATTGKVRSTKELMAGGEAPGSEGKGTVAVACCRQRRRHRTELPLVDSALLYDLGAVAAGPDAATAATMGDWAMIGTGKLVSLGDMGFTYPLQRLQQQQQHVPSYCLTLSPWARQKPSRVMSYLRAGAFPSSHAFLPWGSNPHHSSLQAQGPGCRKEEEPELGFGPRKDRGVVGVEGAMCMGSMAAAAAAQRPRRRFAASYPHGVLRIRIDGAYPEDLAPNWQEEVCSHFREMLPERCLVTGLVVRRGSIHVTVSFAQLPHARDDDGPPAAGPPAAAEAAAGAAGPVAEAAAGQAAAANAAAAAPDAPDEAAEGRPMLVSDGPGGSRGLSLPSLHHGRNPHDGEGRGGDDGTPSLTDDSPQVARLSAAPGAFGGATAPTATAAAASSAAAAATAAAAARGPPGSASSPSPSASPGSGSGSSFGGSSASRRGSRYPQRHHYYPPQHRQHYRPQQQQQQQHRHQQAQQQPQLQAQQQHPQLQQAATLLQESISNRMQRGGALSPHSHSPPSHGLEGTVWGAGIGGGGSTGGGGSAAMFGGARGSSNGQKQSDSTTVSGLRVLAAGGGSVDNPPRSVETPIPEAHTSSITSPLTWSSYHPSSQIHRRNTAAAGSSPLGSPSASQLLLSGGDLAHLAQLPPGVFSPPHCRRRITGVWRPDRLTTPACAGSSPVSTPGNSNNPLDLLDTVAVAAAAAAAAAAAPAPPASQPPEQHGPSASAAAAAAASDGDGAAAPSATAADAAADAATTASAEAATTAMGGAAAASAAASSGLLGAGGINGGYFPMRYTPMLSPAQQATLYGNTTTTTQSSLSNEMYLLCRGSTRTGGSIGTASMQVAQLLDGMQVRSHDAVTGGTARGQAGGSAAGAAAGATGGSSTPRLLSAVCQLEGSLPLQLRQVVGAGGGWAADEGPDSSWETEGLYMPPLQPTAGGVPPLASHSAAAAAAAQHVHQMQMLQLQQQLHTQQMQQQQHLQQQQQLQIQQQQQQLRRRPDEISPTAAAGAASGLWVLQDLLASTPESSPQQPQAQQLQPPHSVGSAAGLSPLQQILLGQSQIQSSSTAASPAPAPAPAPAQHYSPATAAGVAAPGTSPTMRLFWARASGSSINTTSNSSNLPGAAAGATGSRPTGLPVLANPGALPVRDVVVQPVLICKAPLIFAAAAGPLAASIPPAIPVAPTVLAGPHATAALAAVAPASITPPAAASAAPAATSATAPPSPAVSELQISLLCAPATVPELSVMLRYCGPASVFGQQIYLPVQLQLDSASPAVAAAVRLQAAAVERERRGDAGDTQAARDVTEDISMSSLARGLLPARATVRTALSELACPGVLYVELWHGPQLCSCLPVLLLPETASSWAHEICCLWQQQAEESEAAAAAATANDPAVQGTARSGAAAVLAAAHQLVEDLGGWLTYAAHKRYAEERAALAAAAAAAGAAVGGAAHGGLGGPVRPMQGVAAAESSSTRLSDAMPLSDDLLPSLQRGGGNRTEGGEGGAQLQHAAAAGSVAPAATVTAASTAAAAAGAMLPPQNAMSYGTASYGMAGGGGAGGGMVDCDRELFHDMMLQEGYNWLADCVEAGYCGLACALMDSLLAVGCTAVEVVRTCRSADGLPLMYAATLSGNPAMVHLVNQWSQLTAVDMGWIPVALHRPVMPAVTEDDAMSSSEGVAEGAAEEAGGVAAATETMEVTVDVEIDGEEGEDGSEDAPRVAAVAEQTVGLAVAAAAAAQCGSGAGNAVGGYGADLGDVLAFPALVSNASRRTSSSDVGNRVAILGGYISSTGSSSNDSYGTGVSAENAVQQPPDAPAAAAPRSESSSLPGVVAAGATSAGESASGNATVWAASWLHPSAAAARSASSAAGSAATAIAFAAACWGTRTATKLRAAMQGSPSLAQAAAAAVASTAAPAAVSATARRVLSACSYVASSLRGVAVAALHAALTSLAAAAMAARSARRGGGGSLGRTAGHTLVASGSASSSSAPLVMTSASSEVQASGVVLRAGVWALRMGEWVVSDLHLLALRAGTAMRLRRRAGADEEEAESRFLSYYQQSHAWVFSAWCWSMVPLYAASVTSQLLARQWRSLALSPLSNWMYIGCAVADALGATAAYRGRIEALSATMHLCHVVAKVFGIGGLLPYPSELKQLVCMDVLACATMCSLCEPVRLCVICPLRLLNFAVTAVLYCMYGSASVWEAVLLSASCHGLGVLLQHAVESHYRRGFAAAQASGGATAAADSDDGTGANGSVVLALAVAGAKWTDASGGGPKAGDETDGGGDSCSGSNCSNGGKAGETATAAEAAVVGSGIGSSGPPAAPEAAAAAEAAAAVVRLPSSSSLPADGFGCPGALPEADTVLGTASCACADAVSSNAVRTLRDVLSSSALVAAGNAAEDAAESRAVASSNPALDSRDGHETAHMDGPHGVGGNDAGSSSGGGSDSGGGAGASGLQLLEAVWESLEEESISSGIAAAWRQLQQERQQQALQPQQQQEGQAATATAMETGRTMSSPASSAVLCCQEPQQVTVEATLEVPVRAEEASGDSEQAPEADGVQQAAMAPQQPRLTPLEALQSAVPPPQQLPEQNPQQQQQPEQLPQLPLQPPHADPMQANSQAPMQPRTPEQSQAVDLEEEVEDLAGAGAAGQAGLSAGSMGAQVAAPRWRGLHRATLASSSEASSAVGSGNVEGAAAAALGCELRPSYSTAAATAAAAAAASAAAAIRPVAVPATPSAADGEMISPFASSTYTGPTGGSSANGDFTAPGPFGSGAGGSVVSNCNCQGDVSDRGTRGMRGRGSVSGCSIGTNSSSSVRYGSSGGSSSRSSGPRLWANRAAGWISSAFRRRSSRGKKDEHHQKLQPQQLGSEGSDLTKASVATPPTPSGRGFLRMRRIHSQEVPAAAAAGEGPRDRLVTTHW
ncbi:hypothetical protein Agub_g6986 [Astrephomene gubernaculifera]|uniref:Uncharacterized protein n=1 Tax=Astrephomene gubernaculifera TaxID=47775 RepID=A0AAD3HM29_9CHLO|nr:hypothetical protein Agub_g6986 [Astrephomene gubernaculifera]